MRERLLRFLRKHQVLTLAVTEPDGRAYAAALFYAVDDRLRLHVVTDPETKHGKAMLANPSVAGTVQRDRQQWHEIQGVQFRGLCRRLDGEERALAWEIYTIKFPILQQPNMLLTHELASTAIWRIDPTWMRLIDNRSGFGHKQGGAGRRAREIAALHWPRCCGQPEFATALIAALSALPAAVDVIG